jgi:uncharacterized DUF497 family protein
MYTLPSFVEFDPDKAKRNLLRHGVSFGEAEMALRDVMGLTREDPDAKGEQRFITLGADSLGRVLVVIHTPRDDRTRIISARKASRGVADHYHAKEL